MRTAGARFELVGVTMSDPGRDILHLWAPTTDTWSDRVTFAAAPAMANAPDSDALRWLVHLANDRAQALASLGDAEGWLDVAGRALQGVGGRIERLVSLGDGAPGPGPEAALAELLRSGPAGPGTAGASAEQGERWERLARQCRDAVAGVVQATTRRGWVETHLGGRRIGWSVVDMAGSITTVVPARLDPWRVDLHERAVRLTIRSRTAFIRQLAIVARGAALLAVALGTPMGPALALPAAWKFADDVLAEARWHR